MSDCEGCPDVPYPSMPKGVSPTQKDILRGLPDGTSNNPLPEHPDVVYSEFWGAYMGGSPESHLVNIILLMPEGFDRIRVHPDGSLEYEKKLDDFEPPSPIDGYECDPENQWLFKPLWQSCSWRNYKVALKKKCQCIDVLAKCTVNFHWIKFEDCLRCTARLPIESPKKPVKKTLKSLRLPNLDRSSKPTKSDTA